VQSGTAQSHMCLQPQPREGISSGVQRACFTRELTHVALRQMVRELGGLLLAWPRRFIEKEKRKTNPTELGS